MYPQYHKTCFKKKKRKKDTSVTVGFLPWVHSCIRISTQHALGLIGGGGGGGWVVLPIN